MKNTRFAALFALFPLFWACSTEAALQQILGSSVQSPVFYGSAAGTDGGISFSFSTPVTLGSAYFDPPLELESCIASAEGENGGKLTFYFSSDLPGGSKVTADILAEDRQGNTLNVLVPFRTRNTQVPRLIINEIRTENSNMSTDKPRTEFVELLMLSGGNLGALRLFAAGNKSGKGLESPIMEFPPVMVAAGEYVIVHCRTLPSQPDCLDETGSNLGASGGYEATPARDFWIPGSAARIHNTDVIFVMDQDDTVIDGVVLCEKEDAWKNDIVPAARLLVEQGMWNGGDPAQAVSTVNATPTRTVNRSQSAARSAAGWYVKASGSGNESPGAPNK